MIRFLLLLLFPLALIGQTQLRIGVGNASNDGTGDSVRAAMQKVNTNFTTLFATVYTNGTGGSFIRTGLSTNTLSGHVTVDGNLTHDFDLNDIAGLGLDATTLNVRGVQSAYLDGGIMYLRGVTNLNIITPGVRLGTATTGQFLKLTDAIEGEVEFATPFEVGVATLVGGTVTVANTGVTANSRFLLTGSTSGGTPGWLRVSARVNGTSFTILSSSGTDTSVVSWMRIEP